MKTSLIFSAVALLSQAEAFRLPHVRPPHLWGNHPSPSQTPAVSPIPSSLVEVTADDSPASPPVLCPAPSPAYVPVPQVDGEGTSTSTTIVTPRPSAMPDAEEESHQEETPTPVPVTPQESTDNQSDNDEPAPTTSTSDPEDQDIAGAADKAIESILGFLDKQLAKGIHLFASHIAHKFFQQRGDEYVAHVTQVIEGHLDSLERHVLHDSVQGIETDVKDLISHVHGRKVTKQDLQELAEKIRNDVNESLKKDITGFGKSILVDLLKWLAERAGGSLIHLMDDINAQPGQQQPSLDRRGLRDWLRNLREKFTSGFVSQVLSPISLDAILDLLMNVFRPLM